MKVLKVTKGIDKKELYNLVSPEESTNMRELTGVMLDIDAFCIFEEGEDYDKKKVLTIQSKDGSVSVTNSKSFISEFEKIQEIFGNVDEIQVIGDMTGSGHTVLTCRYGGLA